MSFMGFRMMFPVIRIKDKHSGRVHIVGTDSHDTLYVGNDGQLHYSNLQNGDGSGADDRYGYIFDGEENEWEPYPSVEFVSMDGLLKIIKEQAKLSAQQERELRKFMRDAWKDHDDEVEQSRKEGFIHT